MNGGFVMLRCRRCRKPWSTNASPACMYSTSFCPDCIPAVALPARDSKIQDEKIVITEHSRREHQHQVNELRHKANLRIADDVAKVRCHFTYGKPSVRETRAYLQCATRHAMAVLWQAYEIPRVERQFA